MASVASEAELGLRGSVVPQRLKASASASGFD